MTSEDKAWNDAIDALADRLYRYYWDYKGTPQPCAVAYHVKQIAGDLKRGDRGDKREEQ